MKSKRERKRGATRNWRNYDFKRLSPCPPPFLPRPPLVLPSLALLFSTSSSPSSSSFPSSPLGKRKKKTREKPPSPFASLKLPRFTSESQLQTFIRSEYYHLSCAHTRATHTHTHTYPFSRLHIYASRRTCKYVGPGIRQQCQIESVQVCP